MSNITSQVINYQAPKYSPE